MTEWNIRARTESEKVLQQIASPCRYCGKLWVKNDLTIHAVCPLCAQLYKQDLRNLSHTKIKVISRKAGCPECHNRCGQNHKRYCIYAYIGFPDQQKRYGMDQDK